MQGQCACGIEQDVGEAAGAIGQEGLMNFVGTGYEEGGDDGECVADAFAVEAEYVAQRETKSAIEGERQDAVSGEVAGFAEQVMKQIPMRIDACAEEPMKEAVQRG